MVWQVFNLFNLLRQRIISIAEGDASVIGFVACQFGVRAVQGFDMRVHEKVVAHLVMEEVWLFPQNVFGRREACLS